MHPHTHAYLIWKRSSSVSNFKKRIDGPLKLSSIFLLVLLLWSNKGRLEVSNMKNRRHWLARGLRFCYFCEMSYGVWTRWGRERKRKGWRCRNWTPIRFVDTHLLTQGFWERERSFPITHSFVFSLRTLIKPLLSTVFVCVCVYIFIWRKGQPDNNVWIDIWFISLENQSGQIFLLGICLLVCLFICFRHDDITSKEVRFLFYRICPTTAIG